MYVLVIFVITSYMTHVQYDSPITSGKKVISKVKVFVHADTRRGYDISFPDIRTGSLKCLSNSEAWAAVLVFPSRPKTNFIATISTCFVSAFIKYRSAVAEEKSNTAQPIRYRAAILVLRSTQKHTW